MSEGLLLVVKVRSCDTECQISNVCDGFHGLYTEDETNEGR